MAPNNNMKNNKKKNRNKKKKKKKEGEGEGGTSTTGSGNNHNNITTIPTVAAHVGKPTREQLDDIIDNKLKLHGYPRSPHFAIGTKINKIDIGAAIDSFNRGSTTDGCVACMYFYVNMQLKRNNVHLALPWAVECAVRGHIPGINLLLDCYEQSKPAPANALLSVWVKTMNELGKNTNNEETRKEVKKQNLNTCYTCSKEDSKERTLVKCGKCKLYAYCGKDCQAYHWKEGKHMNECRQVILLRKYCKPRYVLEIREAIIRGDDPRTIDRLQTIRKQLGLNRPKEEYGELLSRLDDNSNNSSNNNNDNNNNILRRGTKVKIKGLVQAAVHNGKHGVVTKVGTSSISGEGPRRVEVELSDESGGTVVVAIKIENLVSLAGGAMTTTYTRPDRYEYLVARKDGTVHIGSTSNVI